MLFSTFSTAAVALAAMASSVAASPTLGWGKPQPQPNKPRYETPNLSKLAGMMPKNTMQAPDGLQLKFVGLGMGTQNYTCDPKNETAIPGTTGALAKLYDIGTRLNEDPMAAWKIGSLSGLSLSLRSQPRMLDAYLASQGYEKILGDHFFTEATPTFSLNKVPVNPFPIAFVKKAGFMDAPKSACPGTKSEGAVQWLYLVDDAGRSQGGVNTVYRLETAGGSKPAACKGYGDHFEVPYTAQYWVFGPK